jgi:Na+-transporting NADH:ubiquinone oxidoreductase subunit NqrB
MAATATTTGTPLRAASRIPVPAPGPVEAPAAPRSALRLHLDPHLDPRLYQIAALSGLLAYGLLRLDLEVRLPQAVVILGGVLAAQYACTRAWRLPAFDPRSALISGLSLCLLLRTSSLLLAALAAVVAVAGKFVVRVHGKHVFNPTNFALVVLLLVGGAWVSPGQWGNAAVLGFLIACLGGLVVNRAARADITLAFLASWAALVFGRSFWLGEPMAIPVHRLENGALLIFAFFMISDPRTTPDHRVGRVLFAVLVALGAYWVQFRLFRTNGLLWSLCACAPLVPVIDRLSPATRHAWPAASARRLA